MNKQQKIHEQAQLALEKSIRELVNPTVNKNSAKGVDVFGKTREQRELALLHRAGSKGVRVK